MSGYLKDIAAIGRDLRNRLLFDIYTKDIDYYTFIKSVDGKNMENKNALLNFLNRKIPN